MHTLNFPRTPFASKVCTIKSLNSVSSSADILRNAIKINQTCFQGLRACSLDTCKQQKYVQLQVKKMPQMGGNEYCCASYDSSKSDDIGMIEDESWRSSKHRNFVWLYIILCIICNLDLFFIYINNLNIFHKHPYNTDDALWRLA